MQVKRYRAPRRSNDIKRRKVRNRGDSRSPEPIVRNVTNVPKVITAASRDKPATFFFRYRGGRRRRRYDVLMTLNESRGVCHIEVCHALAADADLPPLATGRLSAARLMHAVDLVGLVGQIASRDHARMEPGRLVFDGHLRLPWLPVTARARRLSGFQNRTERSS